jgi:hypothetical protein
MNFTYISIFDPLITGNQFFSWYNQQKFKFLFDIFQVSSGRAMDNGGTDGVALNYAVVNVDRGRMLRGRITTVSGETGCKVVVCAVDDRSGFS